MRITAIIAFVAAVHIGSASIDAQQPSMEWPPKANSFGNLFTPPGKPPSPPRFLFPTPTPKFRRPDILSTTLGLID